VTKGAKSFAREAAFLETVSGVSNGNVSPFRDGTNTPSLVSFSFSAAEDGVGLGCVDAV
jgi:hypothetical protein